MSVLRDLIAGVPDARLLYGVEDLVIKEVRDDSRLVEPGDLFVAVPGSQADGRQFIGEALNRGAVAVVAEGGTPDGLGRAKPAAWVAVREARWALGMIAARRFGVAERLAFTGITGTNGKTTTTYLLEAILEAAGRRPAVIGTVSYRFGAMIFPAPLTTPGALSLHETLGKMHQAGATDVVMETTSIALDQGRVAGCRFRVAGLTNVTQDHLDYHGTMDRYFASKTILFRELMTDDGVAVVFADREDGRRMRGSTRGRVLTVSTDPAVAADIRVRDCQLDGTGTARAAGHAGGGGARSTRRWWATSTWPTWRSRWGWRSGTASRRRRSPGASPSSSRCRGASSGSTTRPACCVWSTTPTRRTRSSGRWAPCGR